MTSPAGWYADPDDSSRQRYFDGSSWTEHLAPLYVPPPRSIRPRLFWFSMAEASVAGAAGGAFCGALYGLAISAAILVQSEPSDGLGIHEGGLVAASGASMGLSVGLVWGVSTGFVLSLALIGLFADSMSEGQSPNPRQVRLTAAASTTVTLIVLVTLLSLMSGGGLPSATTVAWGILAFPLAIAVLLAIWRSVHMVRRAQSG